MKAKLTALLALLAVCSITQSSELVHNFNSPAFSGLGYSSHVLTIYQLEQQQKE
jgi:hypothetical protein